MADKAGKRLLDPSKDPVYAESFTFKRKYRDAVAHLEPEQRLAFYEALFEAAFDRLDCTPRYETDRELVIALKLAIPEVDESATKNAIGKATGSNGGRPRKNS